jgi:Icc-related predicted phosphoesterase
MLIGAEFPAAADVGRTQSASPGVDLCNIETSERVVAIGDIHGAYASFVTILKQAGIVDEQTHWAAGRTILVQSGDVLHRGPDSRRVLDLLMQLEVQASEAGGRVIALLGNHEAMRMMRDLRYVSAAEYAAFRSPNAELFREAFYKQLLEGAPERARAAGRTFDEAEFRSLFLQQVPLGFVEMQAAFEAEGPYGRWLRTHGAVARINGVVFVHGGISPALASQGCEAINAGVQRELDDLLDPDDPRAAETLIAGSSGPLWYRDLSVDDTPLGEADVNAILDRLQARAIVVGHTVTADGRIRTRFGNRVVQIDTGMLDGPFFPGGRASALEMRDDVFAAIYEDRREELFALRALPALTR